VSNQQCLETENKIIQETYHLTEGLALKVSGSTSSSPSAVSVIVTVADLVPVLTEATPDVGWLEEGLRTVDDEPPLVPP